MLSVCVVILLLSPKGTVGEVYPFGVVLQLIRFPGNFISRYDIFFMMLWMMSYFIFAGGMLLQLVEAVNLFIGCRRKEETNYGEKTGTSLWHADNGHSFVRLLCREGTAKPQLYYVYGDRL